MLRLARNRVHGVRPLPMPEHLRANHARLVDGPGFEASLKRHYFKDDEAWFAHPEGAYDLQDHLSGRMNRARAQIIPWVSEQVPLGGKRVLEIGCGTGSSTVAFVEQKALVTTYDLDEKSVVVARDRLAAHGLEADVRLQSTQPEGTFDVILMYAVLEHMTLDERLGAIREAWDKLSAGGILVIVETPNRLWYYDDHTAQTNFFLWLPDDLALLYAKRTPRPRYVDVTDPLDFIRWGRGVSFHDFEVALDLPCGELPVVSSMTHWLRRETRTDRLGRNDRDRRWERMLKEIYPAMHEGFTTTYLDLILRKT